MLSSNSSISISSSSSSGSSRALIGKSMLAFQLLSLEGRMLRMMMTTVAQIFSFFAHTDCGALW